MNSSKRRKWRWSHILTWISFVIYSLVDIFIQTTFSTALFIKPVPLSALCFVFLSLDGTASRFTVHCRMRGTDVWLQLKIATGLDPPETDLTFRNMEKSNNRKETGWSFILKMLYFKAIGLYRLCKWNNYSLWLSLFDAECNLHSWRHDNLFYH